MKHFFLILYSSQMKIRNFYLLLLSLASLSELALCLHSASLFRLARNNNFIAKKTKFLFVMSMLFLLTRVFLTGCLYESAPSEPASQINTSLLGVWMTQDQSGKVFEAVITPESNTHYHVSCCDKDKNEKTPWEFDGWISRVDNLKLLTLQSLSSDPRYRGKYLFFHYEILAAKKPSINNVAPRRIRITELQLDETTRRLDPYHLRQAIRERLKQGDLLMSEGSSVWTKTGMTTWEK